MMWLQILTFFFVKVLVNGTADITIDHLLDLGRQVCPELKFCSTLNEREASNSTNICCDPCGCDQSCVDFENCCPDADVDFESNNYAVTCQTGYILNPYFLQDNSFLPKLYYKFVSTCPSGSSCRAFQRETGRTFDDIVAVTNSDQSLLFLNRQCAACNGITDIRRWRLLATQCRENPFNPALSSIELQETLLESCIMFSYPPPDIDARQYQCIAQETSSIIGKCNESGLMETYELEVEEACLHPFFKTFSVKKKNSEAENQGSSVNEGISKTCKPNPCLIETVMDNAKKTTKTAIIFHVPNADRTADKIYKNVFCYFCNEPIIKDNHRLCVSGKNILSSYSGILQLELDFDAAKSLSTSRCKDNEFYDDVFRVCRILECGGLRRATNGECKRMPVSADKVLYTFCVRLIPLSNNTSSQHIVNALKANREEVLNNLMKVLYLDSCDTLKRKFIIDYFLNDSFEIHSIFSTIALLDSETCSYETVITALGPVNAQGGTVKINSTNGSGEISFFFHVFERPDQDKSFTVFSYFPDENIFLKKYYLTLDITPEPERIRVLYIVLKLPFLCPYTTLTESEYCFLSSLYLNRTRGSNTQNTSCPVLFGTALHFYFNYTSDMQVIENQLYRVCHNDFLTMTTTLSLNLSLKNSSVSGIISLTATSLSMTCTAVTLGIFCYKKMLKNGPILIFFFGLINLFVAQGVFQFGSGWKEEKLLCNVMGVAVHYFWLAAVFSFNAYNITVLTRLQSLSRNVWTKDVVLGIVYIYILPLAFILINVVSTSVIYGRVSLGYGERQCHIDNTYLRGLLFGLPIFLTVLNNVIVFGLIFNKIKRISLDVGRARVERHYAPVFFRLLIIAGLTWILGFLNEFFHSAVLEYIFITLHASQGVVLFLSFALRQVSGYSNKSQG